MSCSIIVDWADIIYQGVRRDISKTRNADASIKVHAPVTCFNRRSIASLYFIPRKVLFANVARPLQPAIHAFTYAYLSPTFLTSSPRITDFHSLRIGTFSTGRPTRLAAPHARRALHIVVDAAAAEDACARLAAETLWSWSWAAAAYARQVGERSYGLR